MVTNATCPVGCFLLMFNSWGLVNAYGTFASYYKQHLLPQTDLLLWNLVGATESFCVLTLSGVVGRLLDANYARSLVATGAVLVTLGTFLLSVVNGNAGRGDGRYGLIWLTQGLITGLGMACFFVSSSQSESLQRSDLDLALTDPTICSCGYLVRQEKSRRHWHCRLGSQYCRPHLPHDDQIHHH